MERIEAVRVYTAQGWLGPSAVHVDQGRIVDVEALDPTATEHLPQHILVPGFIDLQVNGIDSIDVAHATGADWEVLDRSLLSQGVTTWCPTLVTAPLDRYAHALAEIGRAQSRPADVARPQIAGVHLEGPFLGGAPGAHRRDLLHAIDLDWLADLPAVVRLVTLAPELHAAADAVRLLVDRGVVVALGHTTASYEAFTAAVDAGASLVTHLFNGMSGIHHRQPGVAAFAMADERVSASLIADGVHVDPLVVGLAMRALGQRAVLVTDAVAWLAGRAGPVGLELRDGAPRLLDGTLAGSALSMDAAIRTCVERAGVPLHAAIHAASTRPAAVLGLDDRGDVVAWHRADLVALDADLHVAQVWVSGEPVPGAGPSVGGARAGH